MTSNSFIESPVKAFVFATKPFRLGMYCMYACIVLGNACTYLLPYFLKLIADRITGGTAAAHTFSEYVPVLVAASAIIVGQEVFFRIGHILEVSVVVRAYDRMTSRLYQTLLERPAAYFEEKFSGELSRRIDQVGVSTRYFIEYFPWEIGWPITATVMTGILLGAANTYLMLVFLAWLLLFLTVSFFMLRMMFKYSQVTAEKHGNLSGTIVDVLGNAPVVQAFAAQQHEYAHYRRFMDATVSAEYKERLWGILNKFQQGMSIVILSIALMVTSVYLFTRGEITIGDFVIVAATLPTFTGIVWNFGEIILRSIRSYGEVKNALESLNTDIEPIKEGSGTLTASDASVEFSRVSFSYPGSEDSVLDDFSLVIRSGEKVGFVGRSGAGKSTVVRLLLHTYDAQNGSVKIGGKDLSDVSLQSLREHIAFVPQDTALFHRTLYENILYANPEASKEEVMSASRHAHAHEFIEELPNGYDTLVGERGIKLSGGQRQRIAIARAILKKAPILVLDEATSALDSESEEIVQRGLKELFEHRTVLAIAHRLSTLRSMDRIVVLERGKIAEDGSPQELLTKDKGIFRDMWEHQKGGFI